MSQQEPLRLSSAVLLKSNISDPALLISTTVIYSICSIIYCGHTTSTSFLVTFSILSWLFHYHLESYRSFKAVRKCTRSLESKRDRQALRDFLCAHLRFVKPNFAFEHPLCHQLDPENDKAKGKTLRDTYRWINRVIMLLWPYLSHVVHHQLNAFLGSSGALARSKTGLKRLLYAFMRQLDANILAIEHCELGSNAPFIKSIHMHEHIDRASGTKPSLVYDLELVYEGNMNLAFVCRYFCCCSSRLGLKDVFVNLSSRLVVGPIDSSVPTVERISYSLLELPKFGYKGIALVELAELKIARRSINRLIKDHLLYPKALSLNIEDMMRMIQDKRQEAEPANGAANGCPGAKVVGCANESQPSRLPWTTRMAAQMIFFACMCSNLCLRFCQEERQNKNSYRSRVSSSRIT